MTYTKNKAIYKKTNAIKTNANTTKTQALMLSKCPRDNGVQKASKNMASGKKISIFGIQRFLKPLVLAVSNSMSGAFADPITRF